jgi:hypothetical protein
VGVTRGPAAVGRLQDRGALALQPPQDRVDEASRARVA